MKFSCDSCNAQYSISDDKVKGKIVKVRCKKCQTVISVRDPNLKGSVGAKKKPVVKKEASGLEKKFTGAFSGSTSAKAGPKKSTGGGLYKAAVKTAKSLDRDPSRKSIWFAGIQDSPVGPIDARGVKARMDKGEISDTTLVWREGMADWIPLSQCAKLRELLDRISVGDPEVDETDRKKSSPTEGGEGERRGLFAGSDTPAPADEDDGTGALQGLGVGRLFEDKVEADADPEEDKTEPTLGKPASEDPIAPSLHDSETTSDWFSQPEKQSPAVPDRPSVMYSLLPEDPRKRGQVVKLLVAGFLGACVAVLAMVFLLGEKEVEKVVEVHEKIVEKIVYKDRPLAGESAVLTAENVALETDTSTERTHVKKKKAPEPTAEELAEQRKKELLAQMGKGVGASSAGNGSGGASSGNGSSLSQSQLSAVVSQNRSRLQICYEQSMKKGEAPSLQSLKAIFSLKIGGSGMVSAVDLTGSATGYAMLEACLRKSVKKWVFPSSSGSSNLEFPVLFTPK